MNSESSELSVFIIESLNSAICILLRDRDCVLSVLGPAKSFTKALGSSPCLGDSLEEATSKEMTEPNKQNGLLLDVVDTLLESPDVGVVQGAVGILGTIAEILSPMTEDTPGNTSRVPPFPIVLVSCSLKALTALGICVSELLLE